MKKNLDQQVARQNRKSHNMSLNRGVASAMVSLCFVFSVVGARGGTGQMSETCIQQNLHSVCSSGWVEGVETGFRKQVVNQACTYF